MWQPILQVIIGLVILSFGAEWLVKAAVKISGILGIPAVIIGLTVVSFGTSAPELAVSILSSSQGQSDVAVGNVIGSNIFNILVIIGLAALIRPMNVHLNLIKIDTPVMIGFSAFVFALAWDGKLTQIEGFGLLVLLAGYIFLQYRLVKSEKRDKVVDEEFGELLEDIPTGKRKWKQMGVYSLVLVFGLIFLILGSRWFVDGSVEIARLLGWSELVIGLTLVALGTSVPEVATSVVAAWKGHHDIAVANAIGSNVFNLLAVLGTASSLNTIEASRLAILFDFPVMLSVAILAWPVFTSGFRVERWEGFALIGVYIGYVTLLYLRATEVIEMQSFGDSLMYWIGPSFILLLAFLIIPGHFRRKIGLKKS